MTEYKSGIKAINAPRERVFNTLSDLNNLKGLTNMLPQEHKDKMSIEVVSADECIFDIQGAGKVKLLIVEREQDKTIKFEAQSSPIPLKMWIQLLEPNPNDTRLRLTLHTELNFFIRKMIGNKLEKGVDQIATMLSAIPY